MAKFQLSVYKSIQPGGIKASYEVPDSLAQIVEAIGEERARSIIISNVIYHSVATAIRRELSEKIEEATEQKWLTETKTVNGKEVEVVTEGDEDYTRRAVAAGLVDVGTLTEFLQDLANDEDNSFIKFAKEPERKPKAPKKLPKDIELVVAKWADDGILANVAAGLSAKLGREVAADAISVGWAVKQHRDAVAAKAAEAAKAELQALIS